MRPLQKIVRAFPNTLQHWCQFWQVGQKYLTIINNIKWMRPIVFCPIITTDRDIRFVYENISKLIMQTFKREHRSVDIKCVIYSVSRALTNNTMPYQHKMLNELDEKKDVCLVIKAVKINHNSATLWPHFYLQHYFLSTLDYLSQPFLKWGLEPPWAPLGRFPLEEGVKLGEQLFYLCYLCNYLFNYMPVVHWDCLSQIL